MSTNTAGKDWITQNIPLEVFLIAILTGSISLMLAIIHELYSKIKGNKRRKNKKN